MKHYTNVGTVKALAIRLAAELVISGKETAATPRQFRSLVIRLAHQAFLTT